MFALTPKGRVRQSIGLILIFALYISALSIGPVSRSASAQTPDKSSAPPSPDLIPVIAPGSAYRQTNLVSDWPGVAPIQDPLLVNPWGISVRGTSPFWVANNGTSTSTLYRETSSFPLVKNPGLSFITIPGGLPTGTVGNSTTAFVLPGPCASPPCTAQFIFSSITGNIVGWNPNAPAAGSTTGVIAASHPGHVYTGLALANNGVGNFLYAADFANGRIDVFNSAYVLQPAASFPFADPTIPSTPGNTYHPFNIQNLGGNLYVTYAKVGSDGRDEEGVGNGFVRRFNANGVRDLTFGINNGALNSPWGITIAPASFGIFGGALLVGNFGRGNPSIHAYNPTTGAFLGTIQDESGNGIVIDELWALIFGNGGNGGDVNTLYFAAGIGHEEHGLFGKLNPTTASATNLIQFSDDEPIIGEGAGHIDITVTRQGDVSGTSSVNYATFDSSQVNHASQKTDYELAVGTLNFAAGETSKTFRILIVDDLFDEGAFETMDLILSNVTGAGTGLGTPNKAELRINDNDVGAPVSNPIDGAEFFVRQHFLDFFNREPDASALALINQILACGGNQSCIYRVRADVSAGFFKSQEFKDTGFLAYMTHFAAFGDKPLYGQFELAKQQLGRGLVTGDVNAPTILEANKQAFFNQFVTRPDFVNRYPSSQTNAQFVDALLASAQLSPAQVRLFVVNLTNAQENPPATPTASGGGARPASFGTARLQFNSAQTAMTFTSTVNNIDFTGSQTPAETNDNLTVAHIHAGAAVTPATNGPVVWGFFGTPFNDTNPNDQVVTPFSVGVGGSINGKWDAPEGNGTTLAAQLSNLREGRAYVNFHTTQFPGGEVRGNIPAATVLRDSLVAGLNGATLTRAQVLRLVAEQEELQTREFNTAVANISFFEYLRRDPDVGTLNQLLNWLNSFSGDVVREAARILITSPEYRQRFGTDGLFLLNTAPDAVNDAAATTANTPIVIAVLTNDTDFEGNTLTVTNVTPGVGGTVSTNGTTVTFTPTANFTGAASFTYTITDNGTKALNSATPLADPRSDTATVNVTVSGSSLQFTAPNVAVSEGTPSVTITVTRGGDTSAAATVDYATNDFIAANCSTVSGNASAKCDYATAGGRLRFAAGETSKTIVLSIVDDAFVDGNEALTITLTNPSTGQVVGTPSTITVTIQDNDVDPAAANPFLQNSFFVRMQYLDFLLREPDTAGFNDWLNVLNNCSPNQGFLNSNPACDRVHVSSGFFRSTEFGERGYWVYRFFEAALGRRPLFAEFISATRKLSGLKTPAELDLDEADFIAEFMLLPEFTTKYAGLTNAASAAAFIAKLEQTAGVTLPATVPATQPGQPQQYGRQELINLMSAGTLTPAQTLRAFIEQKVVWDAFFNKGFVSMQYFGYLRRDPDNAGYNDWLDVLNNGRPAQNIPPGDFRHLVFGFVYSVEYRSRFGNP